MSDGWQAEVARASRTHRFEVRPGAQQVEQRIARAVCTNQLAVAKHPVVRPQEASTHRAPGKQVAHRAQCGLGRQLPGVVAHEGHTEAAGIMASCMRAQPVPAAALIHVAI